MTKTVTGNNDKIRLIMRGDDLGMTHGSLVGFEQAMNDGIMTCASLQPAGAWFEGATELCKRNPQWDTGVHLTLIGEWQGCPWRPVLPWDKVPSIVDDNGYLFRYPEQLWANTPKLEDIEAECRAQVALTLKMGVPVHHIDTHYFSLSKHTGKFPGLFEIVEKIAHEHGVPVSGLSGEKRASSLIDKPGVSFIDDVPVAEKKTAILDLLEKLTPGLWLWATHPGIDSPEQRALVHTKVEDRVTEGGGVGMHRAVITQALTDPDVKAVIRRRGIKLTRYRDPDSGISPR